MPRNDKGKFVQQADLEALESRFQEQVDWLDDQMAVEDESNDYPLFTRVSALESQFNAGEAELKLLRTQFNDLCLAIAKGISDGTGRGLNLRLQDFADRLSALENKQ